MGTLRSQNEVAPSLTLYEGLILFWYTLLILDAVTMNIKDYVRFMDVIMCLFSCHVKNSRLCIAVGYKLALRFVYIVDTTHFFKARIGLQFIFDGV